VTPFSFDFYFSNFFLFEGIALFSCLLKCTCKFMSTKWVLMLSKITSNWERKSNENKIRENNKDNEMES